VVNDWLNQFWETGTRVAVDGNKPLFLTDERYVWLVASGNVEVFLAASQGMRHHLFSMHEGELLFGIKPTGGVPEMGLLVSGLYGTELLRVEAEAFWERALAAEAAVMVEQWITKFTGALSDHPMPGKCRQLGSEREQAVPKDTALCSREGMRWVKHREGSSLLLGDPGCVLSIQEGYFPLGDRLWIYATTDSVLQCLETAGFLASETAPEDLQTTNRSLLELAVAGVVMAAQAAVRRTQKKKQLDFQFMNKALTNLVNIVERHRRLDFSMAEDSDHLFAACKIVGDLQGINMVKAPQPKDHGRVEEIARASDIRYRRVALRDNWWQSDSGPMLAYLEEGNLPVALVPASNHSYLLINPATKTKIRIDHEIAAGLKPFAVSFFKSLPTSTLSVKDLLKFAVTGCWKNDLRMIIIAGLAGGLLGLITPKVNAVVFDNIIPGGQKGELWQIAMLLFGAAVAMSIFELVRSFAVLRVKSTMDASVQCAIWDRLLSLPASFFKDYTAGELGMRAMSINQIRDVMSDTLVASVLSSIFSVFYFIQMYCYSKQLTVKALFLVLVSMAATISLGLLQVRFQKKLVEAENKLSGLIFQLLSGIGKIRVSGSENRVFFQWVSKFRDQRKLSFTAQNISNWMTVFNEIFPIVASMVIFYLVIQNTSIKLKTGDFIAFNTAMGCFIGSVVKISGAFITVLAIKPLFDSVKPILTTIPEYDEAKQHPGELTGDIEVNRVKFRYNENGPAALDDVSLQVIPGDYIAVVGPSGSGKSTLLRVLLGFEKPESGCVYYDGQDIDKVDIRAVRRQLGVVLQNGQLMSGDILANIIGSHPELTAKDAWEAAKMAGLDEDIRKMPMGMYTMVSEGGGTLSGGQRQRLMIARAIINRPRLIFFDEATSSLDNLTQNIVSESLDKMNATRIVIAHRLSTVKNCDRIYVMDHGQIVEAGSYEELLTKAGLFADLAKRQLA
jgi:NHLM bacteriocin system ABC transporter ATP-binding protein